MTINDNYVETLGLMLEHKGMSDDDIDVYFLEHYGISGMKWGQRKSRSQRQAAARQKGLGQKQLRGEAKRVSEAGGGIKGTLKVRKEMRDSGELSKSASAAGTARLGRNVALALLTGAAGGVAIGGLAVKALKG